MKRLSLMGLRAVLTMLIAYALLLVYWISKESKSILFEVTSPCNYSDKESLLLPSQSQHVVVDDLVWHVPRPQVARVGGWEDELMRAFKEQHYEPSQRVRCEPADKDSSPYKHFLLCHIPAYVPARLPLASEERQIPLVIFMSWKTRQLGQALFTSIVTILNHNPEYEFLFFTDEDVDKFVCQAFPELAPYFFQLESGAARIDVWRMMMIYRYGGVYLDMDMSALGHLPIGTHDSAVTGMGCWTHVSSQTRGLFEHWALAYKPRHPLIKATLDIISENLRDPNNSHVEGAKASKVESSYIIRLTGPATYQRALHQLLHESRCTLEGSKSYCTTLRDPKVNCNYTTFQSIFGNLVITQNLNMNHTLVPKLLDEYDERYILSLEHSFLDTHKYTSPAITDESEVCSEEGLAVRKAKYKRLWDKAIKAKNKKR